MNVFETLHKQLYMEHKEQMTYLHTIRNNKSIALVALLTLALLITVPHTLDAAPNFTITDLPDGSVKLTANDGAENDAFGNSVSLDSNTAVIGATRDDDAGSDSGSAYVFTRDNNGDWTQQDKLTADDAAAEDNFGVSVAVSGDTVVVGAIGNDDDGENSGSAYVFTRDGNGDWTQQDKLTADDAAASDFFGFSVGLSGDTAVVGTPSDDNRTGSAYVFTRDGNGDWTQQDKLTADDAAASDQFGISVAVDGDTVVVGANLEDDAGTDSGAAYVFTRDNNGDWTQQDKLTADDTTERDAFGFSVAVDGDTVVVGALADDDGGDQSGSAYVFTRDNNDDWTQQDKLTAADAAEDDFFGNSVAVSGGVVVVGARKDTEGGDFSGSAYVFTRDNNDDWTQQDKLTASDAAAEDWFGFSVGVSGNTVVIGAYLDDDAGSDSGSAYIYVPTLPLTAVCQNITVKLNTNDEPMTIMAEDVDGGSSGGTGDVSFAINTDTFTSNIFGFTVVTTLTLTDENNEQDTCDANVFVTSVLDVNVDGIVSPADAIFVINRLNMSDADADVNGSGTVDETDVQAVIDRLE